MPIVRLHPRTLLPILLALACGVASCVDDVEPLDGDNLRAAPGDSAGEQEGASGELPFVDGSDAVETFMQLLPEPTAHGENVAIHIALPAPRNPELADSMVRIFGTADAPLLLFRSDVVAQLGQIADSPGPEFFTTFATLDPAELEQRMLTEERLAGSEVASETRLSFAGRTPVAITTGIPFNITAFSGGGMVALGPCPVMPASTLARWEESLMIIDPAVVTDPTRTRDGCFPSPLPGTRVWSFEHLMTQMAIGSGVSTHDFVVAWLETWLNEQVTNGDVVVARTGPGFNPSIMTEVVEPWAAASGTSANTVNIAGVEHIDLGGGQLDLSIAPFRLSAIVNRIDLGRTANGGGGYGGSTSDPVDAGELRFVFGVQNLNNCPDPDRFSVIFEYGVPISGCDAVRDWATKWTELNDASLMVPFSAPWLAHLESLTQSVVVHGAAPGRGNDNAINQIRTNEFSIGQQIGQPWELREFTLTAEDLLDTNTTPPATPDTPANGLLRPHTLAMTPDDALFAPGGTGISTTDSFVNGPVLGSVAGTGVPGDCATSYVVPADFPAGDDFKGGNSLAGPPSSWTAAIGSSSQEICARHEFSLNTCNGCHLDDTATNFFHVDPTQMPALLSDFLTGGGGVFNVPDTQVGPSVMWSFADLDRRFNRLYDIACTQCVGTFSLSPSAVSNIAAVAGAVPLDVEPGVELPFAVGPVLDVGVVAELMAMRAGMVNPEAVVDADAAQLVRPVETFVH